LNLKIKKFSDLVQAERAFFNGKLTIYRKRWEIGPLRLLTY